ncbi:MAG: NAD-dependent epimerase/dehydratase family protein [Capsulimonadaceae bacterium]
MSTVLVTGGAGFIGSHLAEALAQGGDAVRVLDNLSSEGSRKRATTLAELPGIEVRTDDIRDQAACRSACDGVRAVFHLAAEASVARSIEDPAAAIAINTGGTANILQAAVDSGSVCRLIFSSTCAVYGDGAESPKREAMPPNPLSPYATSKLAAEHLCRNYHQLFGLETIVLRYFNVYGPGQDPDGAYAAVIPRFLANLSLGCPLIIYGDGEQSRDFVHVADIVNANLLALKGPANLAGTTINVGCGDGISLNQLLRCLEGIVGRRIPVERRPPRTGDIKHSRGDISLAAGSLGYYPCVPLPDGLARTLQHFQNAAELNA